MNKPPCSLAQPPRSQRGISMIEVMVTVLVLSIGLLGVAALQGFSLRSNQTAYHFTVATNIASELLDDMRINRGTLLRNGQLTPAAQERWESRAATQLPDGQLSWTAPNCTAEDQFGITIEWVDDRSDEDADPVYSLAHCTRI